MNKLDDCYELGWKHYFLYGVSKNPYDENTEEWDEYEAGFDDAESSDNGE